MIGSSAGELVAALQFGDGGVVAVFGEGKDHFAVLVLQNVGRDDDGGVARRSVAQGFHADPSPHGVAHAHRCNVTGVAQSQMKAARLRKRLNRKAEAEVEQQRKGQRALFETQGLGRGL